MSAESNGDGPAVPALTAGTRMPRHIAIIMDGNNRYARQHGLPSGGGHRAGKDALDPIVAHCRQLGVEVLTVYAFSSENWQRPPEEVALLMQLFAETIREQQIRLRQHQIAMHFIGDRSRLPPAIQQQMAKCEAATRDGAVMTLVIAISYGGQWDMAQAARKLAQQVEAGRIRAADITEEAMAACMEMADLPAVDLLIRTGGDFRLSNFILWQAAYAELIFTPTLWPAFTPQELDAALAEYASRQRRFGQTSEQVTAHTGQTRLP